jgi:hypothetical protein
MKFKSQLPSVTPSVRVLVGFPLHVNFRVEAASAIVLKTSEQMQKIARRLGILAIPFFMRHPHQSPRMRRTFSCSCWRACLKASLMANAKLEWRSSFGGVHTTEARLSQGLEGALIARA